MTTLMILFVLWLLLSAARSAHPWNHDPDLDRPEDAGW